jgi:Lon protease-like protein
MFELSLFPLNTVLFPGMQLPLHIFEARYKQMIEHCLQEDQPFGVVLIRRGAEALGPLAEPFSIGCTARIVDVQPLQEGRMQITAVGEQRIKINSLNYEQPYLVGQVEYYPLVVEHPEKLKPESEKLIPRVQQYIDLLNQIDMVEIEPDQLPEDPLVLGHVASVLLQMPPNEKQSLLSSENAFELLRSINQVYTREIAFLRAIIERGKDFSDYSIMQN